MERSLTTRVGISGFGKEYLPCVMKGVSGRDCDLPDRSQTIPTTLDQNVGTAWLVVQYSHSGFLLGNSRGFETSNFKALVER